MNSAELGKRYTSIIKNAEIADYGFTKGDIIIRPYGYDIWQHIVKILTQHLENTGHKQAYFPLLLPESYIEDEKKYVKGLSPRLFTITRAGANNLKENLVIRPTSELIVNYAFARWIRSYRDLPMKLFQLANICRYEERTRPFIKANEILWLEGHTAHINHEDALVEINLIQNILCDFFKKSLAIPVMWGVEPECRKFAGSAKTITAEAMMPNGQSLQVAAIYDLEKIFSEAFNVSFRSQNNTNELCWSTNWGLGFRLIGAIILTHSDDRGLRLPIHIAPIQVVIIPIQNRNSSIERIRSYCKEIEMELSNQCIRTHISDITANRLGEIISHWEMRGIPLMIIIGNEEVNNKIIVLMRRDTPNKRIKIGYSRIGEIKNVLENINATLYEQALNLNKNKTKRIMDFSELGNGVEDGWCIAKYCDSSECQNQIISKYGKIIKLEHAYYDASLPDRCFVCGQETKKSFLFSKTY